MYKTTDERRGLWEAMTQYNWKEYPQKNFWTIAWR